MQEATGQVSQGPGFLLSRVGTAVQTAFKAVLAQEEIRPLHFLVLTRLSGGDGLSQQELCAALTIDSGNMVELLDRLEGLGFALRSADPRDRRRHLVTITGAGREALARIRVEVSQMEREFFSPLTEGERTKLARTLGKLYANTAEGRGESPPIGTAAKGARR